MKKKVWWLTLTLLLVVGTAQLAAAAPWGFGSRLFGRDPAALANELELTDQQVQQMKDLQSQLKQTIQEFQKKFESVLTPEQLQKAKSLPGFFGSRQNPVEELGLTDEQVTKIKELQREMYEKTKDLRQELQDAMFELRQLRWDKNPDQAALDAKTKEVNDLRAELQKITQEFQQKFESILTPEQLEKAKSMRGFFGGWGGRHGMKGFGKGFGLPALETPLSNTSPEA
ncbi:MAG: hypothetical protein PWQ41_1068 [Bacillota bacterium]|nr:hypothetical protein [Bacillota bacterium]MDK2925294.1 hypothetical protein [Bacillota bacterium]